MNFFKTSFFTDFKLPDVLAQPDSPSNSSSTAFSEARQDVAAPSSDGWDQQWDADNDSQIEEIGHEKRDSHGDAEEADASAQGGQQSGIWGFGGLVKSLTSKSEEMLQAYRKDLQEFSSGLKKETEVIAEVAVHVVKDFPTSLETGASVAQESLESVGQVIEDFGSSVWRGTAEILAQGKEAVLRADDEDDSVGGVSSLPRYDTTPGGKYSRFEAQVRAMQHDSSTYCDEPEDLEDYNAWQSTFNLQGKKEEIESILEDNTFMQELHARFVPVVVSQEIFWTRYFYRLHKLRQTEEARADLVKRATASEEEDLSWDTDEDIEEEGEAPTEKVRDEDIEEVGDAPTEEVIQGVEQGVEHRNPETEEEQVKVEDTTILTGEGAGDDNGVRLEDNPVPVDDTKGKGIDEVGTTLEDEDDLGWEVAEDSEESSSNDGKKSSNSEASWEVPEAPRGDRKARITALEEEDLSWDVDDDEDDVKP